MDGNLVEAALMQGRRRYRCASSSAEIVVEVRDVKNLYRQSNEAAKPERR
jgi:hypothetical protein